jgi:hypothetical protein
VDKEIGMYIRECKFKGQWAEMRDLEAGGEEAFENASRTQTNLLSKKIHIIQSSMGASHTFIYNEPHSDARVDL